MCSSDDEEVIQRRKEARLLAEIAEAEKKKSRHKSKHKKHKSKKRKRKRLVSLTGWLAEWLVVYPDAEETPLN